jgi:hypothetical protein
MVVRGGAESGRGRGWGGGVRGMKTVDLTVEA